MGVMMKMMPLLMLMSLARPLTAAGTSDALNPVRVTDHHGLLEAATWSSCADADTSASEIVPAEALDYFDHQAWVWSDTDCGHSNALATLRGRIEATTISQTMWCSGGLSDIGGHSTETSFRIQFLVTTPVPYTLTLGAVYDFNGEPGDVSLRLALVGVHEISEFHPEGNLTWSGVLPAGQYVLEGEAHVSRRSVDLGGGEFQPETGTGEIVAGVTLEFADATVVPTQASSLGALKALFR